MSLPDTYHNMRRWFVYDRVPVTKLLLVISAITLFAVVLFEINALVGWLGFNASAFPGRPWTAVTYPFLSLHPISLIFSGLWLWWFGGSLERSWGSRGFGIFFFGVSAVSVLGLMVGGLLSGVPMDRIAVAGLWLPLSAVTVAMAVINPEESIRLWCILPIKLKYVGIGTAVLLLFTYGKTSILYGMFALTGCAAAFLYVRSQGRINFSPVRRDDKIIRIRVPHARRTCWNPLKWMKDYREQKRLKDFLDK